MEYGEGAKELNWHIGIPAVLWIGITGLGIIKVLLSSVSELGVIYGVVAIFDAAISYVIMAIIFPIINIAYVVCFFKLFLKRRI